MPRFHGKRIQFSCFVMCFTISLERSRSSGPWDVLQSHTRMHSVVIHQVLGNTPRRGLEKEASCGVGWGGVSNCSGLLWLPRKEDIQVARPV